MFEREGENAGMRRLQEAMCLCFDWARLVSSKPTPQDIHAFGVVAELLLPYLRATHWPSVEAFPTVTHSWPNVVTLQYQYAGLARLVRVAAQCHRGRARRAGWFELIGYVVKPVETFVSVLALLRAVIRQKASCQAALDQLDARLARASISRIASCMSSFF